MGAGGQDQLVVAQAAAIRQGHLFTARVDGSQRSIAHEMDVIPGIPAFRVQIELRPVHLSCQVAGQIQAVIRQIGLVGDQPGFGAWIRFMHGFRRSHPGNPCPDDDHLDRFS